MSRITYQPGLGRVNERSRMSTVYRRKREAVTSSPAVRSAREQEHRHRHQQRDVGDVTTTTTRHSQSRQDIALARQGREGRLARWLDSSQQRSGDDAATATASSDTYDDCATQYNKPLNGGFETKQSLNANTDATKSSSDNWAVVERLMGAVRALDADKEGFRQTE